MTESIIQGDHSESEHSVGHIANGPFFSILTIDTNDIELEVHVFFDVVGKLKID